VNTNAVNLARVLDVLDMDLGRMPVGGNKRSIAVPTMKMVLFCVMRNEGRKLSLFDVADEIGVCHSAAWRAMKALRTMGLVEITEKKMKFGYGYRINSAAIAERADAARRRRVAG
jgi:DNA-binding IclR family transcriptional regulator